VRSASVRANRRGSRKPSIPMEARIADEARFFKSWLDNPAIAGAVSPSGPFLARMMARYVDPHNSGPIIELGPGTGSITEALLNRGIAPQRLYLVEFDAGFCKLLKRRFPGVHVIRGDAYKLNLTLKNHIRRPPAAIVSSLPLLLKPEMQRFALLVDAFQCMARDGCFIQFTYGPLSPVPRDKLFHLGCHAECSPPVWFNIPPARVWVYRQGTGVIQRAQRANPALEFFDKIKTNTEKIHLDLKKEFSAAKTRFMIESQAARGFGRKPALSGDFKGPRGKESRPDHFTRL